MDARSLLVADGSTDQVISQSQLEGHLETVVDRWILGAGVTRLLLLPPDHTRLFSLAGPITAWIVRRLAGLITVDVMPALGTHQPMSLEECQLMFGNDVSYDQIVQHRWREDVRPLGEITSEEMAQLSGGRFREPLPIEINHRVTEGGYDLVLSIGQVVTHEVIGFANYTKNVCIGAGGRDTIHRSHFLGAVCGMESIMGRVDTPVRQAIDDGFERFVRPRADVRFLLTVIEESEAGPVQRGFFAGGERDCYEKAAELSLRVNVSLVDEPYSRCVVFLDPREFRSTWLGNKAIYRTRMAMADEGELIVLAPGVEKFGEDAMVDSLIRKYGYRGTEAALDAVAADQEVRENLSAAAHMIHGSSEGRFRIVYCTANGLSREEIESVGFEFRRYEDMVAHCFGQVDSDTGSWGHDGWHEDSDGQPFYFIGNPALGLWSTESRFG